MNARNFPGILALAALLAVPLTSEAQGIKVKKGGFEGGAYVGGGLSYNNVYSYDQICILWACAESTDYGSGETGLTLTGGYRFHKHIAVEAGYLGESTINRRDDRQGIFGPLGTFTQEVQLDAYQLNVVLVGGGKFWEAWLKAGAVAWDAESDIVRIDSSGNRTDLSYANSGTDFTFGIGLGRRFGENWQVRLDYTNFSIDDELLDLSSSQDAYVDTWSLQLIRHFGS